jgi:hypothetical protein
MRSLLFTVSLLSCWLLSPSVFANPVQSAGTNKPCQIRKVYVAELGSTDEALRFRNSLVRQLSRRFTIVKKQEEADAVLTGTVSAKGNSRNGEVIFDNGELKSKGGDVIWQDHFQYYYKKSFLGRSMISSAASAVASHIRNACKR